MARYTGPRSKIARRFKEAIFGLDKVLDRKNYAPGMHGVGKRRGKQSEYAIQLMEKQKVKYTYGVLEKQFANLFSEAARKDGITGENLLKFLEARLDNTVYRFGLSRTRSGARQLVSHKHILVNGEVVNIPSYHLRPGDVISVREQARSLEVINDALGSKKDSRYNWLEWSTDSFTGKFITYPERNDIPENIKEQLIVELYSK